MRAATLAEFAAAAAGVARQPGHPSFIPAGCIGLTVFATLADLAAELQARAGGRALTFTPCFAAYPGFDTFPALAVDAIDEDVRDYLGTVAIQGRRAEDLVAAAELPRAA